MWYKWIYVRRQYPRQLHQVFNYTGQGKISEHAQYPIQQTVFSWLPSIPVYNVHVHTFLISVAKLAAMYSRSNEQKTLGPLSLTFLTLHLIFTSILDQQLWAVWKMAKLKLHVYMFCFQATCTWIVIFRHNSITFKMWNCSFLNLYGRDLKTCV